MGARTKFYTALLTLLAGCSLLVDLSDGKDLAVYASPPEAIAPARTDPYLVIGIQSNTAVSKTFSLDIDSVRLKLLP
jgi:hypothetical protein